MGPISKQRLDKVHPVLRDRIVILETQLGVELAVVQGDRSETEQAALYAQGRSPLDVVNHLRALVGWAGLTSKENVARVTKARPLYSWHNFAMAVDVAPENPDGSIDWDSKHPVWQDMIAKGEALGLTSGISFEDQPHFQLTGRFPVTPTDEVRALFASGGIQAVWDAAGISA